MVFDKSAASQIVYSLVLRISSGEILGNYQAIELNLVETEPGMSPLRSFVTELEDGVFTLLSEVTYTTDLQEGFGDIF